MKTNTRSVSLRLHRETVRSLSAATLGQIRGGVTTYLTDAASHVMPTHCLCQTDYCKK